MRFCDGVGAGCRERAKGLVGAGVGRLVEVDYVEEGRKA